MLEGLGGFGFGIVRETARFQGPALQKSGGLGGFQKGLGFRVRGLGFRVRGLGFIGFWVQGLGFKV